MQAAKKIEIEAGQCRHRKTVRIVAPVVQIPTSTPLQVTGGATLLAAQRTRKNARTLDVERRHTGDNVFEVKDG